MVTAYTHSNMSLKSGGGGGGGGGLVYSLDFYGCFALMPAG